MVAVPSPVLLLGTVRSVLADVTILIAGHRHLTESSESTPVGHGVTRGVLLDSCLSPGPDYGLGRNFPQGNFSSRFWWRALVFSLQL